VFMLHVKFNVSLQPHFPLQQAPQNAFQSPAKAHKIEFSTRPHSHHQLDPQTFATISKYFIAGHKKLRTTAN
jgi:hypothetical protein